MERKKTPENGFMWETVIVISSLHLLVVCVTSKPKLIGGAYIYTYIQTQHFLYHSWYLLSYIKKKKPVQTCLRWFKKCIDWLLIFIPSCFYVLMISVTRGCCDWLFFLFLSFFHQCVCVYELNKMLDRDIFIVENLVVWLCWFFSS